MWSVKILLAGPAGIFKKSVQSGILSLAVPVAGVFVWYGFRKEVLDTTLFVHEVALWFTLYWLLVGMVRGILELERSDKEQVRHTSRASIRQWRKAALW